ncbi:M1 family metallopeptidase [Streptomyces sp. GMY02]|uniref:M1 family metallopeptidase n=1 Tax=Streptomyces sp. GMY02 TaxID=1333528 RepID=UPI001C2C7B6C|nr:M1 family metallopeptidase [Streptomyces sp. GMY02]QXE33459.1 M1 family metallopeptidase [Streptomyces sp. GMY02]
MRYRTRVTAPAAALLGTTAALALSPAASAAARTRTTEGQDARGLRTGGTPGGDSLGDPVYPVLGNTGYRVSAYLLDFTYHADTRLVDASVTVTAYAKQDLSLFSLDAVGFVVHGVRVDGREAAFEQRPEKLVVTPPARLADRARFTVRVDYTADPRKLAFPYNGWVPTPDGFAVAGQPDLARTVFPCNDHPSDKADFTFRITAPEALTAVATGSLVSTRTANGTTTVTYHSREPLATELIQVTVGDYKVIERPGPSGLRVRDVVPTARAAALEPALSLTPNQIVWLERRLGRFPLEAYGILPANTDDPNAFDFTGLETQTLTIYKPNYLLQAENLIGSHMMHELVHTWFGNLVSPATWADLWLNEGHADYYGLLYRYERGWPDSIGLTSMEARMKDVYSRGDQWRQDAGPVASPTAATLFHSQRYTGGVLVLYALWTLVGEEVFSRIEHTFLDRYRNSHASTKQYIAVASEVSGQDLTGFLTDWLYGTKTPRMPGHPDWTVTPPTGSTARRQLLPAPKDQGSATLS